MAHNYFRGTMRNFFRKEKIEVTNPFAKGIEDSLKEEIGSSKPKKRLDILDADILNLHSQDNDIDFMEIRLANLHRSITQNSHTMDPISLEKMKIEWETLRDEISLLKREKTERKKTQDRNKVNFNSKNVLNTFSKIATLIKIYNPKVKKILVALNEINQEVETLVSRTTPHGEEDMKYGLLVNKIYQASKLNGELSDKIK